ncbi:TETRASPANIN family protein [Melia azedarach]|uniref:TETRASPANIN family protein n=1 Tax=Melia azedarach TaxID=155640 RepID=A0ACC1XP81_MELAZ|nr:TETRASPANIN family protein [Melia azedarach]
MVRVSNFIVGFLNCCSLLAGLVAIAAALFFYIHGGSHCQTTLANPLFVTGIVLVVVSLLGLTGSCCKVNFVLCLYLVVLFLLIVGVSVFTIFCVLITNESAGKTFSNIGIKGLKTWDFNNWLHDHFVKGENWNEIRSCLKDSKSGCCKPPSGCGVKSQNATAPETGNNSDCKTWNNQEQMLCYDCNACKEGFLANIKKGWRNLTIFNICVLVIIIVTYIFGCWARKNNRKDKYRFRKYQP